MDTGTIVLPRLRPPPRPTRFANTASMLSVWGWRVGVLVLTVIPVFLWWVVLQAPRLLVFCTIGVFPIAFTIAWLVGMFVAWYPSLVERRIMRRGVAVVGEVVEKVEESGKRRMENAICYRFAAADGQMLDSKLSVSAEMFGRFEEGQAVVVMYLPRSPLLSVIYEASDYRPA